jgi:signal transduction histidine kinase
MANIFVLPASLHALPGSEKPPSDEAGLTSLKQDREANLLELFALDSDVALVQCALNGDIIEQNDAFASLNANCIADQKIGLPGAMADIERVILMDCAHTTRLTLEINSGSGHETRYIRARYVPVKDETGVTTAIAGVFQDWTMDVSGLERAARESTRYRDFARAAADWFWEMDVDQRLINVSEKITALTGVPSLAYVGQGLEAIGTLEQTINNKSPLDDAFSSRVAFRGQGLRLEIQDEPVRFFHLAGVPIFDTFGQFKGFRGAAVDVSHSVAQAQRGRAATRELQTSLDHLQRENATLDIASAEAQSALKAKDEFLAAMSHELRTPLNAIIGFAETMELQLFGQLDTHYVSYAKDIHTAGMHLLGLINDVLDVSVIESGEVSLSREIVSVSRAIDQARSLIMLRAEHKKIDIAKVSAAQGWTLWGDERRVLQIIVNLLTNAVKFTPSGGQIGIDVQRAANNRVEISVWDTGPGIRESDHERAFEKFQQIVGHSFAGKPEGTGLGLHISRELARLMGGDIHVISSLGAGARFTVSLPAA